VRKIKVPTEDAIGPMLAKLKGDPFRVPVVLTLFTAARRGELLALAWRHVDLDGATLRIERALDETAAGGVAFKQPKTESGDRTITLPAAAVAALREHWRQQAEMRLALGVGRPSDDDLLFLSRDGRPRSPNAFSVAWHRTVRRLGLPKITWHALRHLSASMMLRHGVDLATVSEQIGHSRPDTTARLYLHSVTKDDRHAAAALDRALGQ
jgi:integrase